MITKKMLFVNLLIFCYNIQLLSCRSTTEDEGQRNNISLVEKAESKPADVSVDVARLGDFILTSHATGLLRASFQSKLSFRVSGTIKKIMVHNGENVSSGQMLAQLDDRDQQMALRTAQDQFLDAQVQLRSLIADYGGQGLDTTTLKSNARAFILTKSGYYRAQTALAQAHLQLDYTILKAPFSGQIANLSAKSFNFITSYEPFCNLIGRNELSVEFSVLEGELMSVRIGQSVKLFPIAYPQRTYLGHVTEINPLVNGQGLVLIKARLDRQETALLEGMNIGVVSEQIIHNQLVIPKSAVVDRSGRKVVFTVEKNVAKWHYVSVSYENESQVAISDGLKAGEQVILSGNLNLAHDAPVATLQP